MLPAQQRRFAHFIRVQRLLPKARAVEPSLRFQRGRAPSYGGPLVWELLVHERGRPSGVWGPGLG